MRVRRIVIELDDQPGGEEPESGVPEPLQGWVCPESGDRERFVGYVGLIGHIEALRRPSGGSASQARDEDVPVIDDGNGR